MKTRKLIKLGVAVGIALCMTVASLPALAADPPADDTKPGANISSQNKIKDQKGFKKPIKSRGKVRKNVTKK